MNKSNRHPLHATHAHHLPLPAQFQGCGREELVGRIPNDLADARGPGVEDVVEPLLQELRGLCNAATHDVETFLGEKKEK